MRRIPALLSAVVGLVAALLIASPAQAATYGVSLTVSNVNPDVGTVIRLTGAVSGSKAAKKTLTVQRSINGGAWTKVGTVKTAKNKSYAFNHRVGAVGSQQFRVIAPKKGSTKQGVSAARLVTGWTWLWLAQQPHATQTDGYWDQDIQRTYGTFLSTSQHPHSVKAITTGRIASWTLNNSCDRSDLTIGLEVPSAFNSAVTVTTEDGGVTAYAVENQLTGVNIVNQNTQLLHVFRDAGPNVILFSPRVHCSVARLPNAPSIY